ncbi:MULTISPECIES: hypothetical protein [Vibrio]|uniref:hypothetical protein n=1 Tax=Vibrio TaxID=662 RepID=UPI00207547AA|nr:MULTISPECIES: hypothetical protein [Vibrio]USD33078.1 hypothetical protein J8Z27_02915 [Vibrio sp. SCSIO 43186]USD46147.1 hypothetical protein J4N38_03090 [Vibrio sp. SCSIO 43145]USD70202.1 hypothetical protein J4N41_02915 [Vibrio sp. SCSIO 43139]USD95115.1 hypothetical protein CTT30_02970 [Vibrio coralliilyticus]
MKHTVVASMILGSLVSGIVAANPHSTAILTSTKSQNILVNSGFEDNGLGWHYWFANIKDDQAFDGQYRGRIAIGAGHSISQTVTIPETGVYQLSVQAISPSNDARVELTNLADEPFLSKKLKKSHDYKHNKVNQIPLEKGERIKLRFTGTDAGSVSIDQVELVKSNTSKPPHFNQVIDFETQGQVGESIIDKERKTIEFELPYASDLSSVVITQLGVSQGSQSSVEPGDVLDFTQPVDIELSDEKGRVEKWQVQARVKAKQVMVSSSNTKLQESFDWAMEKTRQFVMTGQHDLINRDENNNDGTGSADYLPSYWAGYFDRTAFYSRDFLHQSAGAKLAGLERENFAMFKTFAKHSTESRKWYTLWAINFDGSPHLIDYEDDDWFVREVPAQFEFLEKAWEQYLWTGDRRYIEDKDLWRFYTKVMTDYISLHDDQDPNGIAEGYGGIFEGSATYNERGEFPIEAGDGIGSQYQATVAYAAMLNARDEYSASREWQQKAQQLKNFFNQQWSIADPEKTLDNYVNIVQKDGLRLNDFGKENSWFMPMKLITEPGERNDRYLDFIAQSLGDGIGSTPDAPNNIEAYSYIPETYFPYNRNEEAWKWMQYIMDMKDLPHERPTQGTNGDYPEISFTFIANTIEGLMGVKPNAADSHVITASHLTEDIDWLAVDYLPIGEHEVALRHDGTNKSTLTNNNHKPLTWEAWFYGEHSTLLVNGKPVQAKHKVVNGLQVSYVQVEVLGKESHTVSKGR